MNLANAWRVDGYRHRSLMAIDPAVESSFGTQDAMQRSLDATKFRCHSTEEKFVAHCHTDWIKMGETN